MEKMAKYQVGDINNNKDTDPYFDSYDAALKHASQMATEGFGDGVYVGIWEYYEDEVLPDLRTIVTYGSISGVVLFSRAVWVD